MVNRHSLSKGAPQKLRERLKVATTEAILEAAEEVFADDGVQKARMETIAQRAGVSVGTLYNHFETREALFQALVLMRRTEMQQNLDAALAECDGLPFPEQIAFYLVTASKQLERRARFLRILMEAEHVHGKMKFTGEALSRRTEQLIARGVKMKVLRSEDAEIFPMMLQGVMRTCMVRRLYQNGPELETIIQPVVRFFLEGAGAKR